jgi:hypothetical protein
MDKSLNRSTDRLYSYYMITLLIIYLNKRYDQEITMVRLHPCLL